MRKGAQISYTVPFTPPLTLDGHKLRAVEPAGDTLAAADCVLILTSHSQFDYRDSPSGLRWSSTRAMR